jgi:SAM-dependent methyltransferase
MGLLDDRELFKQKSEVDAWIGIADKLGESFMAGVHVDGDLEPYRDRVLVDVGCGPRPFVERFPARLAFMIDCCMLGYREQGLLRSETLEAVCCVDAMAERLPLRSGSVDILFAINMLDHTFDPAAVMREFHRVLKPEGMLHLQVDLGGEPNACEPVVFDQGRVEALIEGFRPVDGRREPASNPTREERLSLVLTKETRRGDEEDLDPAGYLDVLVSPDGHAPLRRIGDALCTDSGLTYPITGGIWDLRPRTET